MDSLKERVVGLFANSDVVTTDALAEALFIDVNRQDRTRAIRLRLKRVGMDVNMISHQAWMLSK